MKERKADLIFSKKDVVLGVIWDPGKEELFIFFLPCIALLWRCNPKVIAGA